MKVVFEKAGQRLNQLTDHLDNDIALALVAGDSIVLKGFGVPTLIQYKIEWRRIHPGLLGAPPAILFSVIEIGPVE